MKPIPRQFTLGSIMIAIAIVAVVLAFPKIVALATIVTVVMVAYFGIAFALIVIPGCFLLGLIDRRADARKIASLQIGGDSNPGSTGFRFLDPETTDG